MSTSLMEYSCPCCGGKIEFNATLQKMKCPFCDTEFEMDTLKSFDEELSNTQEQEEQTDWDQSYPENWGVPEGLASYTCESCGGEVIADQNAAAATCPFCDHPVVMKGQLSGVLKPDYVIPFKLEKESAIKAFASHLVGKRLLPKDFKDSNHLQEIKGVYVPFWLFDCDTDSNINYRATKVRSWSSGDYHYTETSYFLLTRGGRLGFSQVPVDGSSKMPDDLMDSIEPFDYKDCVDFQTAYLAGYLADKYDVDSEASKERANARIRESTIERFRQTASGYTTCITEKSNINIHQGSVKYALLPVWILNTTYKEKKYTYAMNGQTGKFVGDLPIDKGAFARWFLGITAGVTAVLSLIRILFG